MSAASPSVLTSDVYNEAETVFNTLQNKEKLVSFLDCTTLLRGMGMNPTREDMDKLMVRMAEPVQLLEQWRREEELKREKERRKEEQRQNRKGGVRQRPSAASKRKSAVEAIATSSPRPVNAIPMEEIKNIDWNIFITCAEEIYRDATTEEKELIAAIKVFSDPDQPGVMTRDRLIQIVTSNGDSVLTPPEVKQLVASLPEECSFHEMSARIQGTYVPPSQEELDQLAAKALEERRRLEEAEKSAMDDPLTGL